MNQIFFRRLRTGFLSVIAGLGLVSFNVVHAEALSPLMYFNGVASSERLVLGADGRLYGPASASQGGGAPGGLLFYAKTDGTDANTFYQYGRLGNFVGNSPHSPLLVLSDGTMYGSTLYRTAAAITNAAIGSGTLYKIAPDGTYTKLHDFADFTARNEHNDPISLDEGVLPQGGLIQGRDGFLYGVTQNGGASGTGTIFKIRTDGTGFAKLYSFDALKLKSVTDTNGVTSIVPDTNVDGQVQNINGAYPARRLAQAADGFLYGVTTSGGANGTGTLFKLNTDGTGFAVVKTFDASPAVVSGAYPSSGLLAVNGVLYGTTSTQGPRGAGTVFSVTTVDKLTNTGAIDIPAGTFTTVHAFSAGDSATVGDGAAPSGDLILANDGTLVGTTSGSFTQTAAVGDVVAVGAVGTIYSVSLNGATFNTIYKFNSDSTNAATYGVAPVYGVVQDSSGNFYGTTSQGGQWGLGTVFKYGTPTNIATPIGTPEPFDNGGGAFDPPALAALLALLLLISARSIRAKQVKRR